MVLRDTWQAATEPLLSHRLSCYNSRVSFLKSNFLSPADSGTRLDRFVARISRISAPVAATYRIRPRPGQRPTLQSQPTQRRRRITVQPDPALPPKPRPNPSPSSPYEDDDLILINKPAGMTATPERETRAARSSRPQVAANRSPNPPIFFAQGSCTGWTRHQRAISSPKRFRHAKLSEPSARAPSKIYSRSSRENSPQKQGRIELPSPATKRDAHVRSSGKQIRKPARRTTGRPPDLPHHALEVQLHTDARIKSGDFSASNIPSRRTL